MTRAAADPSPTIPPGQEPSLLPREHGAWGQLAMPILTGLALGAPGAPALLLAAAFVIAFLAHEPLLVVLGQRGFRLRDAQAARAVRRTVVLAVAGGAAGVLGLLLAPPSARTAVLAPAALGVAAFALVSLRLERTTGGEILVATALAACAAPLALASGAPASWAWSSAFVWAASFCTATLSVRAILLRARTKGGTDRRLLAAAGVAAIAAGAATLAWTGTLPAAAALAILPTAVASLALTVVPVRPQRLAAVGWSLVAASVAGLLVLVLGLRLA